MMQVDPITYQVISATLAGIVQEMQNSLFRTGFSTIIRESQDASCALLDAKGNVIAQHVVLPLHMGAFPASIEALLTRYDVSEIEEGDAYLVNHPYFGGSPHAPDMAVIVPIFYRQSLIAFSASIAHKSDIGGPVPGSCLGSARETYNEGLHLPPVKYVSKYKTSKELETIIGANSRTPELVIGDIRGQVGACRVGGRRLSEVLDKYGVQTAIASFEQILHVTEAQVRSEIAKWPDGVHSAERFLDDDGVELGKPVRIRVSVHKTGDRVLFDFTEAAEQTKGPANIRPPIAKAACAFCLVALIDNHLPINQGLLRVIETRFKEGTVLNPRFPAPVNTYNPTVHALIESLYECFSYLVPGREVADGCGSRSIILGGRSTKTGRSYVQYELMGGGSGGRLGKDGVSGTMVNHSNGKVAPIEIIESEFPTRILRFDLIRDSAGAGRFRGGLGFIREYQLINEDARFSIRSTKHSIPPNGVDGGKPGRAGACIINPGTNEERRMPTRYSDFPLPSGSIFRVETPGGGGCGDPLERDPEQVLKDIIDGYVSINCARQDYGVIVEDRNGVLAIDAAGTEKLRATMKVSKEQE